MRLTIDKLYGEIVVLMTYCATGDVEYLSSTECTNRFKNILETIKEYKTIEEEFGIDLTTLVKALKSGVYIKKAKNYDKEKYPYNAGREDLVFFDKEFIYLNSIDELAYEKDYYKGFVSLRGYGKTWALTKEEL